MQGLMDNSALLCLQAVRCERNVRRADTDRDQKIVGVVSTMPHDIHYQALARQVRHPGISTRTVLSR